MKNIIRIFPKITAATLMVSCILLTSPGVLLADDTAPAPDSTSVTQPQADSPALDVQPLSEPAPTDSVVLDTGATSDGSQPDAPPDSSAAPLSVDSAAEFIAAPADTSPALDTSLTDTTSPSDQPVVQETPPDTAAATDTAVASDPSSDNTDTGADSTNNSTTDVNNNTDITNQNYANIFNDSYLNADTGNNSANFNTGSGVITTSKANGDGRLLNILNVNQTQVDGNGTPSPDNATNQNTGSASNNNSETNINNQLAVKNVNEANVINRITANVNSGNNAADYNTGHGMIATGDANLGLNFFSFANANLFGSQKFYANLQNIYNSYTGNIDLSNELNHNSSALSGVIANAANNSTGEGSNNQSVVNINDQTTIDNQNSGNINNEIDANVVSGQNEANYNTGTGSISTGDVNSSVNLINFLNSNVTSGNWLLKTLNVFGDWQGDLTLPAMSSPALTATALPDSSSSQNSSTGSGSDNSTNSDINNSFDLNNNNAATIENNVTVKTSSGDNTASNNGGSGVVAVGSANAETNEMNVANLNVTGGAWYLVVVNRFGNWNGTAVNAPEATVINTTGISTVITPEQSGVNVTNNPTGADSNNSAGVNINHKTDISNNNQANITNTLNIDAVSGENTAKLNTGHGYIQTGNIKGTNNIINFANANITVGDWVVVVVNVFGNWDGNLVFNTSGGGQNLNVGGSLSCPVFNTDGAGNITSANNATGSGSQNDSATQTNTNNTIGNNNSADLNNTTSISSTTGQNEANYNTGSGNVTTGQADAGSSVGNQANTNNVQTGQGSPPADSTSNNNNTGSDSTNTSTTTNNSDTNTINNNDYSGGNDISGTNNTGQNASNYNTGDGSVDTGWASAFVNLMNQVNDNQISVGDLTNQIDQAPQVPAGQDAQIPLINSPDEVCPGVTIEVTPADVTLAKGATQQFTAVAKGPDGNPVTVQPVFTWTATGGTIDDNGLYTAGDADGTFAVTATASYGNQGTATIIIDPPADSPIESNPAINNTGSGGGGGGGSGGGGGISSVLSHVKGDYNNDGKVDDLDFSILMANWDRQRTGFVAQDGGEGIVGDKDFSIVMSNWTIKILVINK
jgi:hypothetical protein